MSRRWQADCGACLMGFEHPVQQDENPYPNGLFCPECKGRAAAVPILHFRPLDAAPRFFAPDELTPAQTSRRWVEGDVWATMAVGELRLIEANQVDEDDGRLLRGRLLSLGEAQGRFSKEITAYRERVSATKTA